MGGIPPSPRARPLVRAWRRLTAFHDVIVLVAHSRGPDFIASGVEFRPVDPSNVADGLVMDGRARVDEFRGFLARGDVGLYGYLGGRVVHRSWARFGPLSVPIWHQFGNLEIGTGEGWIHYCETAPAARGLHAYPAALCQIVRENQLRARRGFWIATEATNRPSIRGIERAGFAFERRFHVRVRFGRGSQTESPIGDAARVAG
jgi:hypothetical protein